MFKYSLNLLKLLKNEVEKMKIKKLNKSNLNNKLDKDTKIILFAVLILLISVISFNFTGMTGAVTSDWADNTVRTLIGWMGPPGTTLDWTTLIIYLVIFVMLAVAFSDVFSLATPFSTPVAWILGFGIAIIGGVTGFIRLLAYLAFTFVAGFGVVTVVIVMCGAFVFFIFAGRIIRKAKLRAKINKIRAKGRLRGGRIAALGEMAEEAERNT